MNLQEKTSLTYPIYYNTSKPLNIIYYPLPYTLNYLYIRS